MVSLSGFLVSLREVFYGIIPISILEVYFKLNLTLSH